MPEYTIDELSRKAGSTVRNVRAYQDKGLLPPPRRKGRLGVYSEIHLARLRLIGKLLDRGYTLGNIAELISAWEKGQDIAKLIGLESAITSPFSTELPTYITFEALYEMFGPAADSAALMLSANLGILELEGDRVRVTSPRLLNAGAELAKVGLPLHLLLSQISDLRGDVHKIAYRFVQLIIDQVFNKYGEDRLPPANEVPRIAELVRRLRPMAQTVVEVELARALEDNVASAIGDRLARVAGSLKAKQQTNAKKKPAAKKRPARSPKRTKP
jgi:DNA-binding transcriptional MerR regulator